MSVSKNLLLILTRNPELGKCKTRLAKTVGEDIALEIYKFLLAHTHSITKDLEAAKHVYYSEYIGKNDIWEVGGFHKFLQQGLDLGKRMEQAFTAGFESGYEHIIIIGSDMYDLSREDLEEAFDLLQDNDAVIGPASDGGYYLLGLRRMIPEVFADKDWGNESVFQATMEDLKTVSVALLQERNDIDRYEDIVHNPVFAPFLIDLRP